MQQAAVPCKDPQVGQFLGQIGHVIGAVVCRHPRQDQQARPDPGHFLLVHPDPGFLNPLHYGPHIQSPLVLSRRRSASAGNIIIFRSD